MIPENSTHSLNCLMYRSPLDGHSYLWRWVDGPGNAEKIVKIITEQVRDPAIGLSWLDAAFIFAKLRQIFDAGEIQ